MHETRDSNFSNPRCCNKFCRPGAGTACNDNCTPC